MTRDVAMPQDALAQWNDRMYEAHPTPYQGLAGLIERSRIDAVRRLAMIRPDDAVLEIGCEAGTLLASLPPVRRLVGVDISARALTNARARLAAIGRRAELIQLDAQQPLPFAPGAFDVILCSDMLEVVPNPRAVMAQIHAVTTPSTRVVLSVPDEARKLRLKRFTRRLGLFPLLFPGIEPNESEWHTHAFSRELLFTCVDRLFRVKRLTSRWGIKLVVSLEPAVLGA